MADTESSVFPRTEHPETRAGDPFAYAAERLAQAERGIPERRTEEELVEAIAADEARQERPHTASERLAFAYGFHAPSYRADLRRLMALGVEGPEDDEE